MSVKNVETRRPPITAIASGWFASVPTPSARAIGRSPTTVARTVMRMGRRRMRPARGTATRSGSPWRRRSLMYSTRSTPFETTMPTIMMIPMKDVVDKRARSDREIVEALRPRFAGRFPGTTYRFVTGGLVARTINFGAETALEVEVLGYDLATANLVSQEVARIMQGTEGVSDVTISRDPNYPEFVITVDREKAAFARLSQLDIARAALFSLNSNVSINPSLFTDPRTGNQYNVVVQLDEPYRRTPDDLGKIFVTTDDGRPVTLSTVAVIKT